MSLWKAVESERLDDVKAAIESGEDINQQDGFGITPLMQAVLIRSEKIVKYLCENNADVNIQSPVLKDTVICLAAEYNIPSSLEILLEHGADVSLKTSSGETALDIAVKNKNNECVQIFKEHINNALWKAVATESSDDVKSALELGADINKLDKSGITPLMQSSQNGSEEIVKLLCEHNASLNVQSLGYKHTAVCFAASYNNVSCLEILLKHGADASLKTSSGETALHLTIRNKHNECTKILKEHMTSALWKALKSKQLPGVRAAIELGADINQMNGGYTPLMEAVLRNSEEIVKCLCENNAMLDVKSHYKDTAAYLAAKYNYPSCLETLIQFGADIFLKNSSGKTALEIAVMEKNHRCIGILKIQTESQVTNDYFYYYVLIHM